MKLINIFYTIILSAFMLSCSGIKVTTDMEKTTDFSQYKTFSFMGWQNDSDQIMSEFDKKRMRDAFKLEFEKRDLKLVAEGGDMAVSLFIVVSKETSTTAYTNYYGGYGGRYGGRYRGGWGGGSSSTTYSESDYLKGTLVMDIFDEKESVQIWQGVATGTVSEKPEKREKSIPSTIAALMKKFPVQAE